jgi:hypothetical protein
MSGSFASGKQEVGFYGAVFYVESGALLLDCPDCNTPLRMNPFFVDIDPIILS